MPTYSLRCRNAACRHRRTSKTHPDDYRRMPACEVCGAKKGWRIESCKSWHKHQACNCGQVVGRDRPIPHNRWHPLCDQHPEGKRNQLLRQGVTEADLPIELMGKPCRGDCPF